MEKEKVYSNTYFPPEVIIEAVNVLTSFIEDEKRQRTEVTRRITRHSGLTHPFLKHFLATTYFL